MNDTPPPDDPSEEDPTDQDPAETTETSANTDDLGDSETTEIAPVSGFKAKPLLIVAVMVAILFFIQAYRKGVNREARQEAELREQAIANSAVTLYVKWSEAKQLPLYEEKWFPGMTVRDLMQSAENDDILTFEETGEGDAAMLTSIGGTENEGGGTDSQNWIFRVDGKMADRSFAIFELEMGNNVTWEFTTYDKPD